MADIRCPNCGRNNPDILDICQFCQTPLKPDSILRIGQTPTKKNTGELESVLPDWLKDVRQQARDSAQEDAAQSQPRPDKNEPPDLLAGLASQASSGDEEDVPDWLASINPEAQKKPATPSTPETDFFAQFNKSEPETGEPASDDALASPGKGDQASGSEETDELSAWFTQAADQPEEVVELEPDLQHLDRGWESTFDSPRPVQPEPPKEEEDLGWLHNLEEASKQTGDLKAPKRPTDWGSNFETPATPSQPSGSKEDLSWLDKLSGIEESEEQLFEQGGTPQDDLSWLNQFGGGESAPARGASEGKPSGSQEDLSWLNDLQGAPEAAQPVDAAPDQPISSQPFASEEDLSWLNSLGGQSEPQQPLGESVPEASEKPSSEEDLSWLNNLGGTSEPVQPFDVAQDIPSSSQEDLSWLKGLGEETEPPKPAPRQTAPLGSKEEQSDSEPDWLKSAIAGPSMPAPGDVSMDWFTQKDQTGEEQPAFSEEKTPSTPPPFSDIFSVPSEAPTLSNPDVDSLFSAEMPDWLSRPEPAPEETPAAQTAVPPIESEDALAPVDLPSWVQAMRPVESMISETAAGVSDGPEEKEGPLAGLRGVIPGAAIGSSMRPKAVSLKLQATEDQQASAALLEQILATETSPRALIHSPFIASQHVLRWVLAGLFLLVLSTVIILRSQRMPVSPTLLVEGSALSNTVMSIPAGANVLIIIDYEPSLAGEMEAVGSPLLDQMVSLSHPNLSFVSTSPNGPALVERLLASAKINTFDGFGYQAGIQYRNLGFLPGGSAGVLGFLEQPGQIIPDSQVGSFAEYATVIVMTDHAESGRIWVEQLQNRKQVDPLLAGQPLLMVASAQAGPLLQPYVSSQQISGMISGLSDAARYEASNSRAGIARSYWDTFGIGLAMAVALIIGGSLWSFLRGIRARRAEAAQG